MIVFSSVSKSFADKQTAIVDLNLEINEGDLLVITGPSGAGKTTFVRLLMRLFNIGSGKIMIDG
ncbi:MAG: Choline ABC transporter, ATP-binding protein OpuBA, partial [Candidatus Pacebacteria bacterium GW2011_GWF1_36_5]